MTYFTANLVPEADRERCTAMLELRWVRWADGVGQMPMERIREFCRIGHKHRLVLLFVLDDLYTFPGHRLHWSAALYKLNEWLRRLRGYRPITADEFWTYLLPALESGVIACRWDLDFAADWEWAFPGLDEGEPV